MRPWCVSPVLVLAACVENATPEATETPVPPGAWQPDLDGRLTAAEVPVVIGVPLDYYVGANVGVDVAGQGSGDTRRWDWSEERAGDGSGEFVKADVFAELVFDEVYDAFALSRAEGGAAFIGKPDPGIASQHMHRDLVAQRVNHQALPHATVAQFVFKHVEAV